VTPADDDGRRGKCGARTRSGGTCGRPAGWGTDHVGYGACKLHGGATPNAGKAARREMAREAVDVYGLPREIDPAVALLEELYRTAGHVSWLGQLIAEAERGEDVLKQFSTGRDGTEWEKPSVWVELYQWERKHLASVAADCVRVGIEERRVRLAEQQGELLAAVIRGVLTELGVADRPEVPAVVRRHLMAIEATAVPAA
jgi:hypothetical protein